MEEKLEFFRPISYFTRDYIQKLSDALDRHSSLVPSEHEMLLRIFSEKICATTQTRIGRVLILELNLMRENRTLVGDTPEARWDNFLEQAATDSFWTHVDATYPSALPLLQRVLQQQVTALMAFVDHWTADRAAIEQWLGSEVRLTGLSPDSGDTHMGGRSVMLVVTNLGPIVYKPRNLAVDEKLAAFVNELCADFSEPTCVAVPAVLRRGDHGWAKFIAHRFAANEQELRSFYQSLGHWLAIMGVVGGSDLHAENLIAHGPHPYIIDCETLFTPRGEMRPTGLGEATDKAVMMLNESVIKVGLLPARGGALAWRGIDNSGIGMVDDQQPMVHIPGLIDAGTDGARIGMIEAPLPQQSNHPSARPSLADHWEAILAGYEAMVAHIHSFDASGWLEPALAQFRGVSIRAVLRGTEGYAELMRMLWHPISLRNPEPSRAKAREVLGKMARNSFIAPEDPAIIEAEINDLLAGDVPIFHTRPELGMLTGPAGLTYGAPADLIAQTLTAWRNADHIREGVIISASLASAYMNEGYFNAQSLLPPVVNRDPLEPRRRAAAARTMTRIIDAAFRGQDGTAAWAATNLSKVGWNVRALEDDLYSGLSGLALLCGAYQKETRAGRSIALDAVEPLLHATLKTLNLIQDRAEATLASGLKVRPPPPGGYIGLGSVIWARLWLARWGVEPEDNRVRAERLALQMPEALAADDRLDILMGAPSAIPPLLMLASDTGNSHWLSPSREAGDRLIATAEWDGPRAFWRGEDWPDGLGGFAHGTTGVGWALYKLARATGDPRYRALADGAFAFENSLFDEDEGNWLDMRGLGGPECGNAWCHGSVGIALAQADLDPDGKDPRTRSTVATALTALQRYGFGWNHCLCHGDFGSWELYAVANRLGIGVDDFDLQEVEHQLLSSVEHFGPVAGVLGAASTPGLIPGIGGIAYQLLRMHPESSLPSVMMLES